MKEGHITLADVAKRARVSVSTASRALAGLKVNKKNLAQVQKAAADLGYVMNEAARSLRNEKTMTVGLVFHELNGPFGLELLSAVSSRFDEQGYCVFVATAQGDRDRYDKLVHRFLERRVDALLCVHCVGSGAALERFAAARVPVIALISKHGGYRDLPLFAPSANVAVLDCVKALQALGHQHALLLRHSRPQFALDTFMKLARTSGMSVHVEAQVEGPFDPTRILELCRAGETSPSVIVASQVEAGQILAVADRMKIAIPQHVSLVAVRDRAASITSSRLPLSMIYLDPQKVGIAAADMLINHFAGGALTTSNTMIEMGSWLEQDTTGPAQQKVKSAKKKSSTGL